MSSYVALFRGINVGGKHILPMQDLRDVLVSVGCENVQTYIQSGNAVFSASATADSLSSDISDAIDNRCGFAPQVLVLTVDRFKVIMAANPFPAGGETPQFLHVWFLTEAAIEPDLNALQDLRSESEQFALHDDAFFLLAPDGIGRSKLAAKVDRYLGVPTTARNWRTVSKLCEMIDESDSH